MSTLSRDVKNTFNFLRWRRASIGAVVGDLPICDLNPIELLLPAPTNLTATAFTSSRINLSWDDNATNEIEFQIERSLTSVTGFVQIATVAPNITTYQDTGLDSNTTYYYRVRAVSASLVSDYSNEANATTLVSFDTQWNTTNPGVSASNQITLPLSASGSYNFVVEWGDGTLDTITAFDQPEITHSYSSTGTYDVKISGVCDSWIFNNSGDKEKLLNISAWGSFRHTSGNGGFFGCSNMTITATDGLVITSTTMNGFFQNCSSITTIPGIETWDVSTVTAFNTCFQGVTNFNQSLNNWDVSNVTGAGFGSMFRGCSSLNQDFDNWDVSGASQTASMFFGCSSFNGNVTTWDFSNISNTNAMFFGCVSFNQDISGWVTTSLTDTTSMFSGCQSFNQNISGWDFSNVFRSGSMFNDCFVFNQNVGLWDTSSLENAGGMFRDCIVFNQNLNGWNTSLLENAGSMFFGCTAFNGNVTTWNTGSVTNMKDMFLNCSSFNQDISGWNTANVTTMETMFSGCTIFNQDISGWNVANVTDMTGMLNNCSAFNQPIGNWTTTSLQEANQMLAGTAAFDQSLAGWDITNVTTFDDFMNIAGISTANYDATLIAWEAQAVQNNVPLDMGSSQYTIGGAAQTARANLIADHLWVIVDGGGV